MFYQCFPTHEKDEWGNCYKAICLQENPQNEPMTPMGSEPKTPYLKILNLNCFFSDIVLKGLGFFVSLQDI